MHCVQDSNSIPPSPHMPKIHNIHIRREGEAPPQPARPRSAQSTTTLCSETSVDFEVQNILGHKPGARVNKAAVASSETGNESQEIIIDFDSSLSGASANGSFAQNNSYVINGVKRSQTFNNRKNLDIHDNFHGSKGYSDKNVLARAHSLNRSSAERSLDEMSLYDQKCVQIKSKKNAASKKDPRDQERIRNLVLAEIKAMPVPRSLSESDLSDLGGASPGHSPAPGASEAAETDSGTLKRREHVTSASVPGPRSRSSPGCERSTPSSGYSELTSSTGN